MLLNATTIHNCRHALSDDITVNSIIIFVHYYGTMYFSHLWLIWQSYGILLYALFATEYQNESKYENIFIKGKQIMKWHHGSYRMYNARGTLFFATLWLVLWPLCDKWTLGVRFQHYNVFHFRCINNAETISMVSLLTYSAWGPFFPFIYMD